MESQDIAAVFREENASLVSFYQVFSGIIINAERKKNLCHSEHNLWNCIMKKPEKFRTLAVYFIESVLSLPLCDALKNRLM